MTPAEILRAAKAKIADPAHWCRDSYALTRGGRAIGPTEANACRWCALGAVRHVVGGKKKDARVAESLLAKASMQMKHFAPWLLNDTADHATVMAMYDRAIALAEQEGADHDRP